MIAAGRRGAFALVCSLALMAAQEPPPAAEDGYAGPASDEIMFPLPPDSALEHFTGYEFDFEPGDFAYLRGAFPEATAQEKARWQELATWLDQCEAVAKRKLTARLAELGVQVTLAPDFKAAPYLCRQIPTPERAFTEVTSMAEIEAALPKARLVYDTLIATSDAAIMGLTVRPGDDPGAVQALPSAGLADEIIADALRHELLVSVFEWTAPGFDRTPQLALSPEEVEVLQALTYSQLVMVETANVVLLGDVIAERGWPRISDVGSYAATKAWQIAYNTSDLAFQVEALRAMEPLLEAGEVEKRDYAMLFDRVNFFTTGRQRYGTLQRCEGGRLLPEPVEDEAELDRLREAMGLVPMAERGEWETTC